MTIGFCIAAIITGFVGIIFSAMVWWFNNKIGENILIITMFVILFIIGGGLWYCFR